MVKLSDMKQWLVLLKFILISSAVCSQQAVRNDTIYEYKAPSDGGIGKFYMGREIAGIMDASGANWLERSGRPTEENSDRAVRSMQLNKKSVVADIGAGSGYYTFRIASRVPEGKVYAVEIQDRFIKMLNDKKRENGITNVEVVKGDTLTINLPLNSVDIAIMVDVYHELSWPKEIINSIKKCLKPDGKLMLMEYRGEDPKVRIRRLHKTTVEQLKKEMQSHGFELERRVDELPIQHFLVFRKA